MSINLVSISTNLTKASLANHLEHFVPVADVIVCHQQIRAVLVIIPKKKNHISNFNYSIPARPKLFHINQDDPGLMHPETTPEKKI